MSGFGWSHPPGAESDPYAPYNQDDEPEEDVVEISDCTYCEFAGPFSPRVPCPACGYDPLGRGRGPHPRLPARWVSTAVWWKPATWFSGAWEFLP